MLSLSWSRNTSEIPRANNTVSAHAQRNSTRSLCVRCVCEVCVRCVCVCEVCEVCVWF